MSIILDKIKVTKEFDRRLHLSDTDRDRIRSLYADGMGIRAIAREYEKQCTRRLIQFILFPERYEKTKEIARKRRAIKGNTLQEYGKKAWAKTMRDHRRYKRSLLEDKKIK